MTRSTVTAALALLSVALLTACSSPQPGVSNRAGTLQTTVAASPSQVIAAAEAVLNELDLIRVTSVSTELDGTAMGRTASGTRVSVSVRREAETLSRLSVRVGTFGERDLGLVVLNRIEERLGGAAETQE